MLLDLATSVAAVNALIAKHPLLPAEEIVPSKRGIAVHLHSGFADFEAWREGLQIRDDQIIFRNGDENSVLRAEVVFHGVPLTVASYSSPMAASAAPLKAVS